MPSRPAVAVAVVVLAVVAVLTCRSAPRSAATVAPTGIEAPVLNAPSAELVDLAPALQAARRPPEVVLEDASEAAPAQPRERTTAKPMPTVPLIGRVVSVGRGAPVEGIEVVLDPTGGSVRLSQKPSKRLRALPVLGGPCDAVTNEEGLFQLEVSPTGSIWATFVGPGWSPQDALLRSGGAVLSDAERDATNEPQVVVEVERAARVEGRVVGAPAGAVARASFGGGSLLRQQAGSGQHATLRAVRDLAGDRFVQASVSPSGDFVVPSLPAGTRVTLALLESAMTDAVVLLQEPEPVTIRPGEVHRVDWTLADSGSIACSVRDFRGGPAANIELWLVTPREGRSTIHRQLVRPVRTATSDEGGRALFAGVHLGAWAVALAPPETRGRRTSDFARYALPCDVTRPGDVVQVDFELCDELYIEGVVQFPEGAAVDALVFARSSRCMASTLAKANGGGQFRVGPLLPGKYVLWVQPGLSDAVPFTAPLTETVEAGTIGVELKLTVGARLKVRTVDSVTGLAVAAETSIRALDGGAQSWSTVARSESSYSNLGPGRYSVRSVGVEGQVGQAEVELRRGQEQDVEVMLALGALVAVRNADPTKTAVVHVERKGDRIVDHELVPMDGVDWCLVPGSYTVVCAWREPDTLAESTTPGVERRVDIEVRAGDTRTLELRR